MTKRTATTELPDVLLSALAKADAVGVTYLPSRSYDSYTSTLEPFTDYRDGTSANAYFIRSLIESGHLSYEQSKVAWQGAVIELTDLGREAIVGVEVAPNVESAVAGRLRILASVAVDKVDVIEDSKLFVMTAPYVPTINSRVLHSLIKKGLVSLTDIEGGRPGLKSAELSEAGRTFLGAHPEFEAEADARKCVANIHWTDISMYSRGRSPIRGGGVTMGAEVRCSCKYRQRSNQGRTEAEYYAKRHIRAQIDREIAVRAGVYVTDDTDTQ